MRHRLRSHLAVRRLEDRTAPATFTVINVLDAGAGSLRDCVNQANANPGADDIVFSSQFDAAQMITLTTGQILISGPTAIQGKGLQRTSISGNNASRIFGTVAPVGTVISFSGLTLRDGNTVLGGALAVGDEAVTIANCALINNSATSAASSAGGAIHVGTGGSLTLLASTVSGNSAVGDGGGIYAVNCGTLTIRDSTISGNSAVIDDGGGLQVRGVPTGAISIVNSTFSGNSAGGAGGGVGLLAFASSTLTIQNSTFTKNTASAGGGIGQEAGSGTIALESTIMSGNSAVTGPDLSSLGVVSAKSCSILSPAGFTITDLGGNRPFGENPRLLPLQNNGGPTETHALEKYSPLVDTGSNPGGLPADQRGAAYLRHVTLPDIGAYETAKVFLVTNYNDAGAGSLRQAVADANLDVTVADLIRFNVYSATPIVLTSGEMKVLGPVEIDGESIYGTSISANGTSRIFNVDGPGQFDFQINGMALLKGATNSDGGAILVADETLTVRDCEISGCVASKDGGGIAVGLYGALILQRSTISGNVAFSDGGGIYFFSSGSFTILDSTVSGNLCDGVADAGGGMYFFGNLTGPGLIRNSTFSGNRSNNAGGGFAWLGSSTLSNVPIAIQNSTFTLNLAVGGRGGGISRETGSGTISLMGSVVAQNTGVSAADLYFSSPTLVSSSHSLIGAADKGNFTLVGAGNQTGTHAVPLNAKLRALGVHGGPTRTHFPQVGSPILDKGGTATNSTLDQRGFARLFNGAVDVGAVEVCPQNFWVDTAADLNDGVYTTGELSLREAIDLANSSPTTADTITFDGNLQFDPISLGGTDILIGGPVKIGGPNNQVIDGSNLSRVFNISGAGLFEVELVNLDLRNGKAAGSAGGAVLSQGQNLSTENCHVYFSTAASGGGVAVLSPGTLVMTDSQVTQNTATTQGGGLVATGGATLIRSRVNMNSAPNAGGISAEQRLTLIDSTISNNKATGGSGGGIDVSNVASFSQVRIQNSTISGNTAASSGGGIVVGTVGTFSGTLRVINSTITANTATGGTGAGLSLINGKGLITLESSIVSKNLNAPDILTFGTVEYKTSALFSSVGISTLSDLGGNLPLGVDLQLGPLQYNGGSWFTHLPSALSPVLNKGSNPSTLPLDQRGAPRQFGTAVDMGAVERQSASMLVVDITVDESDGDYAPSDLSLREAIGLTSASAESTDTITFDPVVFAGSETITLALGEIPIGAATFLIGPSAQLTISADYRGRIFNTTSANALAPINLSNLVLRDGFVGGAGLLGGGGAIYARDEVVSLNNCVLTDNFAPYGSAISVEGGGRLTATNCVFSNNDAPSSEHTIYMAGVTPALVLRRSTVSGNRSSSAAIRVTDYLLIDDSTISDNEARYYTGGAILATGAFAPGALRIRNSTISGNSSAFNGGGGVYLHNVAGTLVVQNSTIAFNSAASKGGGILVTGGSPIIALESSIVSKNSAASGADISTFGAVQAKTSSIFSAAGIATYTNQGGNRPFSEDPLLLPLANNGGPTQTHALAAGSPVINQGGNPASLASDQRGVGFLRNASGAVDMGAFEVQAAKVLSVQVNDGTAQRSRVTSLTITFDQPPALPAIAVNGFQLKRQSDLAVVSLNASLNGNAVTLTFTGGPVNASSLADGRYTLTVLASQILNLDGNGDGVSGDDYVLVGNPTTAPRLFRYFGDNDGDGDVDAQDYGAFRGAFGSTSNLAFDFDNDGDVDAADFGQFRARFGTAV